MSPKFGIKMFKVPFCSLAHNYARPLPAIMDSRNGIGRRLYGTCPGPPSEESQFPAPKLSHPLVPYTRCVSLIIFASLVADPAKISDSRLALKQSRSLLYFPQELRRQSNSPNKPLFFCTASTKAPVRTYNCMLHVYSISLPVQARENNASIVETATTTAQIAHNKVTACQSGSSHLLCFPLRPDCENRQSQRRRKGGYTKIKPLAC